MKRTSPSERHKLLRKSKRIDEISQMTDEERERQRSEAIARGMEVMKELDPIVRETYKDNPEKLAEWDAIMHMADDPEDEPEK